MLKFVKNQQKTDPLPRSIFAWNRLRAGDFIIFKKEYPEYYEFVYIPGGDQFNLTKEDFHNSVNAGILSFVEQLPEEIYNESLQIVENNVELSTKRLEDIN